MTSKTSRRDVDNRVSPRAASDPRLAEMSAALARNWWAVGLRGALAVLFGLAALLLPAATLLSLVLVFAAYMLADGLFAIVSAVRAARRHQRWGMLILQGLANLAAAAVAIVWPGITVLAFVYLMAGWAVVSGLLALAAAVKLQKDHGRVWLGLSGLLNLAVGLLLALAPLAGALVLTWWIGIYAIVYGVALLVLAFQLRPHKAEAPATTAPA